MCFEPCKNGFESICQIYNCYKFYTQVAEELLAKVKLTESARVRARSYSGGMKRRLSVAIALIGDPKLVILDEPVLNDA